MALNYIGHKVDYTRLVQLLRIRPGYGTPFPVIQSLGNSSIRVVYGQGNLQEIYHYLSQDKPCIVPVQTHELPYWNNVSVGHAVVVVGVDSENVFLNDPEFPTAPIQVTHGDFGLAWFEYGELFAVLSL